MKSLSKIILVLLLSIVSFFSGYGQAPDPEKLEELVQSSIRRAKDASVFLTSYDSVGRRRTGTRFSGVVVSQDGLILTAGHVGQPNGTYLVIFPDGTEYVAVGLGRIRQFDAAVLKINTPGTWTYAEMGWSSSMQVNEPCMSIAYPGSFNPARPVVRFGYIAELPATTRRRMLRTTCLMEPGDSGGPVFDLYGRVIGIRSNISVALEDNFDVAVDNFRKYWTAFLKPEDYSTLPAEEAIQVDPLADRKFAYPQIDFIEKQLERLEDRLDDYTRLLSNVDGSEAVGFLVSGKNFFSGLPGRSFIISKSSLVKDGALMSLSTGKISPATVLYRDEKKDLVLLSIAMRDGRSFDMSRIGRDTVSETLLGKILISPHPVNTGEVSVLGSTTFTMPDYSSVGYFGSSMEMREGRSFLASVQDNSPAKQVGLAVGDEVLFVNGVVIRDSEEFVKLVQNNKPNDVIRLEIVQNGEKKAVNVILAKRPMAVDNHPAERFADGKSERRDGFDYAFVHDGKLKPSECGGPIFDLKGNLIGLNLARLSRTSSIAVSNKELLLFLESVMKK